MKDEELYTVGFKDGVGGCLFALDLLLDNIANDESISYPDPKFVDKLYDTFKQVERNRYPSGYGYYYHGLHKKKLGEGFSKYYRKREV